MLEVKGICKYFAGVTALDHVDFILKPGEIHALLGENGAGKSTLMKIISGVYVYDEGKMLIDGQEVRFRTPKDALAHGISIISQELSLCEDLSVAENIFMGNLPRTSFGAIDWNNLYQKAGVVLEELGVALNPKERIKNLSTSQKQLVEIAKSVNRKSKIILMDEPTSALTPSEVEYLFAKMRELANQGLAIVFISHKLDEVFDISDRITLLRNGQLIAAYAVGEKTKSETIELMLGRSLAEQFGEDEEKEESEESRVISDEVILSVKNLNTGSKLHNIKFELHKGEILGIYGLMGSGRTELLRAIYCSDDVTSMELTVDGKAIHNPTPAVSIKNGVVLIPEERKLQSLFPELSVRDNISIPNLDRLMTGPFVNLKKREDLVDSCISEMNVKTPGSDVAIKNLSGGNQQKAIIGRWLKKEPKVILMDEPTKGIDVGAKAEIYKLMRMFSEKGYSILCVSSEVEEIQRLCDRVLLIREGCLCGELSGNEVTLIRVSEELANGKEMNA